jgi:hypothetical protein
VQSSFNLKRHPGIHCICRCLDADGKRLASRRPDRSGTPICPTMAEPAVVRCCMPQVPTDDQGQPLGIRSSPARMSYAAPPRHEGSAQGPGRAQLPADLRQDRRHISPAARAEAAERASAGAARHASAGHRIPSPAGRSVLQTRHHRGIIGLPRKRAGLLSCAPTASSRSSSIGYWQVGVC